MSNQFTSRRIIAKADGSKLTYQTLHERSYLVVPCISQVLDKVVHPVNQEFPELVTTESILPFLESRNGRPVVMDHPFIDGDWKFANEPQILEQYAFGHVFNTRVEDGRVKCDLWLDEERANQLGEDAIDSIQRIKNGEILEVSEGNAALIDPDASGIKDGKKYQGEWLIATTDHLAILPRGVRGACDVDNLGCGANRIMSDRSNEQNTPIVSSLSQARRPTYTGTESTRWTTPKLSDYVRYLYEEKTGPTTVSACSTELKTLIASHTLLGDPTSSNFQNLTTFPVVNPASGKLNERALRGIISRDGTDDTAIRSAIDMARRLLNSEFGVEMNTTFSRTRDIKNLSSGLSDEDVRNLLQTALREVESNIDYLWVEAVYDTTFIYSVGFTTSGNEGPYERSYSIDGDNKVTFGSVKTLVRRKTEYEPVPVTVSSRGKHLFRRIASLLRLQTGETMGDNELWKQMATQLYESVPGFNRVFDIYQDESKVIYVTVLKDGWTEVFWTRSFTLADGTLTLSNDETEVEPVTAFEPKSSPATETVMSSTCGCNKNKEDIVSAEQQKPLIDRLIANSSGAFKETDRATLGTLSVPALQAMADKFAPVEPKEQAATNPTTPPANTTTTTVVQSAPAIPADHIAVPKDKWESVMAMAGAHEKEQQKRKDLLVSKIVSAQSVYTKEDLASMSVPDLEKIGRLTLTDIDSLDYTGARLSSTGGDSDPNDKIYEPPNAWGLKN